MNTALRETKPRTSGISPKRTDGLEVNHWVIIWLFVFLFSISYLTGAFGAETAQFLKIGIGARPVAMGYSLASVADDLNALTYNPAGLSQMSQRQGSFTHAQLFSDTQLDFAGYAHPLNLSGLPHAALGFGVTYLSQGAIAGRDANRQATGNINASDMSVQAGLGAAITSSLRVGTGVRFIRSQLASSNANTVALDFGGQWHQGRMELGAAILNIGPGLKYMDATDSLPLTYSVGAGYRLPAVGLLLAANYQHRPLTGSSEFSLGTEYAFAAPLTLRAGYDAQFNNSGGRGMGSFGLNDSGSNLLGLATGLGLKILGSQLDYAFTPMGPLGTAHRITLSTNF